MTLQIPVLTALLFLTACGNTLPHGNEGFRVPSYTKEQTKQVYDELITGCCPMSVEFLKDYKVLRDQARIK